MNIRKGIIRLLIVWLIVWAVVGYFGWIAFDNGQKLYLTLPHNVSVFNEPNYTLAKTACENSQWGLHLLAFAFWLGLMLPICTAIVFAGGRWVYKGFRV